MKSITQDMRFGLSLIRFAQKYGVSRAARKYKTNRQYISLDEALCRFLEFSSQSFHKTSSSP